MLRTYARLLAAALVLVAVATAALVPKEGPLLSVPYLGSAAVFAYAGFSHKETAIVRIIVAAAGSFFLLSGLLVAIAMSALGFPFGGRGWEVGLAHAALGGLSMACAVLLPCDDDGSATR
jgi:hypothetical protein